MSRVLVIGATGLLGRYVVAALESRGHETYRSARSIGESGLSHRIDLADVMQTTRVLQELAPEVVVQTTGGHASGPVELAEVNIVPTVNLIRAAITLAQPPALFVTGSAAEYGDQGAGRAAETSSPRPVSPYGWIKVAETSTALALARAHGLRLTVLRPFNPVTPDLPTSTALGNFRHQLLEQTGPTRTIVSGRVDVVRDFVTGQFIGEVTSRLVVDPPGGVVNICSGAGVRLEDIMLASCQILGVELQVQLDPGLVAIPAPQAVVGDPERLYSLVGLKEDSSPHFLAKALLGQRPLVA